MEKQNNTAVAIFFLALAVVLIGGLIVLPTATIQSALAAGEGGGCGTGGCSAGNEDEGSGVTGGGGGGSGIAFLPGSTDTSRANAIGGGGGSGDLQCGSGAFLVSSPGSEGLPRAGGGGSCPSEPEPEE